MRTRPDVTRQIDFPSGSVTVDEAGYLIDPKDWTRDFAQQIAQQEEIPLSDLHWDILDFMRAYHDEHGIAADARFALEFLGLQYGLDRGGAKKMLFELFPYGYVKQACKMAGMRQPRAWSTG